MEPVATFWCETTGEVEIGLRRYDSGPAETGRCPARPNYWSHGAEAIIGRMPVRRDEEEGHYELVPVAEFSDHPQWPTECECGYVFTAADHHQVNQHELYRAADGREWRKDTLPVGAMYDAFWLPWRGADGISLTVVLPPAEGYGDHWHVDSRARNCDAPDLDHFCWVRTGDPRTERVHVTKGEPGESCTAGAGSIATPDFHGYLHHGWLKDA